MAKKASDMTVEEFKQELALMNDRVVNFKKHATKTDYNGRHMRGFMTHITSNSLKRAMQRRRTKYTTKP